MPALVFSIGTRYGVSDDEAVDGITDVGLVAL